MSGPPVTPDTVPTHPDRTEGPLRPSKTALILAAIGLFFVAIQVYGYVAWLLADPKEQPEGNDPVPASVMANVDRAEAILIVLTVVWIAALVSSSWRAKGLTWPLLLTFAWSAVYWQEPLVNALDHNFTYNAHLRDRGDWVSHLPFSPVDGPTLSQPLFEALVFFALLPIFGLLSYAILRGLHRIGLHSPLLLVLSVWLIFVVLDAAFEMAGIAQGLLVWNRVADNLAISAGTADQWPVYEGIMLGFLWALPGMLMFFRGGHRFSVLDPGIDVLPGVLPVVVRLLALAGLLNVAFLAYNIALMVLSGSTLAPTPSWLSP